MKTHPGNCLALALAALALNLSVIQPAEAATWGTNSPMITARDLHTATLLSNGKVLVAGGYDGTNILASAELYDPNAGSWTPTGTLTNARQWHTATLLLNGKVLVAGGTTNSANSSLASAELYDPATGTWTNTGALNTARYRHTATLLPNGQVLVVGGVDGTNYLTSAELFDPATGLWMNTGALTTWPRYGHTATLLPNGQVLVAGGGQTPPNTNFIYPVSISAELYDPTAGLWTPTANMNYSRWRHTATLLPNGQVLVAGGVSSTDLVGSAELYNPTNGTWTTTGAMAVMPVKHTATLLPDGLVMVTGGQSPTRPTNALFFAQFSIVQLYDPATGIWTVTNSLNTARYQHTATLLPNGKVLITGGADTTTATGISFSSTELYDPAINPATGTWTATGLLNTARKTQTATLLPNGEVLIAGGFGNTWLANAELFDPVAGIWTTTNGMNSARSYHTATLLSNGKVLVAGGQKSTGSLAGAELFDWVTGLWANTGSMNNARCSHSTTLLPNGKVLVAGGGISSGSVSSAEIYDPVNETWTNTGTLKSARALHTATLLLNGKVLVAGGFANSSYLSSAELYDPITGIWTNTGSMNIAREHHTATLLPNGKVLVAGGNNSIVTNSVELYDPITGNWTMTGSMSTARAYHTAILLPNGKVLVAGGQSSFSFSNLTNSAELYDPVTGNWTITGYMTTNHAYCTMTLLSDGKTLVAGGAISLTTSIPNSDLYDVGLGYTNTAQPQITSLTSPLNLGGSLVATGSQFRGISEGSSGNTQDSPADYPLVQLRHLDNEQTVFLLTTNWSTNTFTSVPVWNFPAGYALATVFVNGIQSTSSVVNISVPVPISTTLTGPQKLTNGFQFAFTNSVGALFGVLTTTNLALPLTNWTALGGVVEVAPGQFQFTDPQATNNSLRFYRAYAP